MTNLRSPVELVALACELDRGIDLSSLQNDDLFDLLGLVSGPDDIARAAVVWAEIRRRMRPNDSPPARPSIH